MALAVQAGSVVSNKGTGVASLTTSLTVAAGSNRVLRCAVGNSDNAPTKPTSVTYGGVAMVETATYALGFLVITDYHLINPPVGTANLVTNWNPVNGENFVIGYCLTDGDQTTPVAGGTNANGVSNTATVVHSSSSADNLIIDTTYHLQTVPTIGAGQTLIATISDVGGYGSLCVSYETGSGSQTMSWVFPASHDWITRASEITFAAGAAAASRPKDNNRHRNMSTLLTM